MCITLRICCLLVKQVISKIIDSTYQERMKYLFKGQKNWIPCRMKAVFTAKVLGWICSPLIYSAYPRAWHRIGLNYSFNWQFRPTFGQNFPRENSVIRPSCRSQWQQCKEWGKTLLLTSWLSRNKIKWLLHYDCPTFVLWYLFKQPNKKCDCILIVRFLCLGKQKDNHVTTGMPKKNLLLTSWQSRDKKKSYCFVIVRLLSLGKYRNKGTSISNSLLDEKYLVIDFLATSG